MTNPVAARISVPLQYNAYDETYDDRVPHHPQHPARHPVSISEDWNLISRTILPVVVQEDMIPGTAQAGMATTQSLFFSPKEPTALGLIWGVGPAALIPPAPTTSHQHLGPRPDPPVLLKQQAWAVERRRAGQVAAAGPAPRR